MRQLPLVSILIPNFNHSRYLDRCITSAINQTYPNTEIYLLDNCSTDNSVEVASKYPQVHVCKNQVNIMNISYRVLVDQFGRGKYFILLCADDYILPDFIESAVSVMEKYPEVGYVHIERDFVTPDDELIELDPFYKCSFVAPGHKTMPIYMITTVAHPAQALVRKNSFQQMGGYDMEIDHMNADRALWFYLSNISDAAYIRSKYSHIRVGAQTETVITQANFQHPIMCHLTILDFVKFAEREGIPEVYVREEEALKRLAKEFVGYAGGMLVVGDSATAKRYLDYACVVDRDVVNEKKYIEFSEMIEKGSFDGKKIEEDSIQSYQHKRGYNPPDEYKEIDEKELVKWLRQEYKY